MAKTIMIRGKSYTLSATEQAALKEQLNTPSRFVGLNTAGYIVAEGDVVVLTGNKNDGDGIEVSLSSDGGNTWWYYGDDEYTVVTRKQYEALKKAGLAH